MFLTANNAATLIGTNWPAADTAGIWTAVSGKNPLLYRGVYVGTNVTVAPRTALGLGPDGRYLFLLTIDGRQPGYSDGATDLDTAVWLGRSGAYDAVMLDGGGSSTMVVSDGQGGATLLNQPIHNNVPGMERAVGNHLGIYAGPPVGSALVALALARAGKTASAGMALAAASPPLRKLTITPLGPGTNRLTVHGLPDYTCRLQYTESLTDPKWQTLTVGRIGESGLFEYTDTGATSMRFHRAVSP